jgi:hypothetical protein
MICFFRQNPLMMFFSGLFITSYIFDFSEKNFYVSNHILLCFIIWVLNLQQLFRLKSTLFTVFSCMKLILTHYRSIWCFIVYTSYGCFFEGHLRWFNRWPLCSLFHNVYNLRVTRNIIRGGSSEEVWCPDLGKGWSQGSGRRKWTAHAGQGLVKVRVLGH